MAIVIKELIFRAIIKDDSRSSKISNFGRAGGPQPDLKHLHKRLIQDLKHMTQEHLAEIQER